ncbi:MAG: PIN domain-containing protein [Candidatus Altiarchaeia archaeon]
MKLVIDANILFAALITSGRKRQSWIIDALFSDKLSLYAPERLLSELFRHREEIIRKSGYSPDEYAVFMEILKLRIQFISFEKFAGEVETALKLAPHPKDAEYFALALSESCPIYSEEKAFKKQSTVKVFNAKEIFEYIKE